MHVNLDELLKKLDGWNLILTVNGNQFLVDAPSDATEGRLGLILAGDKLGVDLRPELEQAIAPLIREPTVNVQSWKLDELAGAATAVVVHAREIRNSNSRGIIKSVVAAMQPTPAPASEQPAGKAA